MLYCSEREGGKSLRQMRRIWGEKNSLNFKKDYFSESWWHGYIVTCRANSLVSIDVMATDNSSRMNLEGAS